MITRKVYTPDKQNGTLTKTDDWETCYKSLDEVIERWKSNTRVHTTPIIGNFVYVIWKDGSINVYEKLKHECNCDKCVYGDN